jgi:murein tripeptide amidase MpaA
MVNPDGVIVGNYRTGMAGRDLNREFIEPDIILYPSVYAIKQLLSSLDASYGVLAFLDLHGHSSF